MTEGFEHISFSKVIKNIHAIQKLIFQSLTMFSLSCQTHELQIGLCETHYSFISLSINSNYEGGVRPGKATF